MLSGILLVFSPLLIGYLLPFSHPHFLKVAGKLCLAIIVAVLMLMGVSLTQLDNLSANLPLLVITCSVFVVFIIGANALGLLLLHRHQPVEEAQNHAIKPPLSQMAWQSIKIVGYVILGMLIGKLISIPSNLVETASEWCLMLLLLLIGIELRHCGISFRQIILNRTGLIIALTVWVTSWLGGILAAIVLKLPILQGLTMASGFGWYTLTGILITDAYGPLYGGIAFITELVRELIALAIIPLLIQRQPSVAIGVAGATAMDFTLPIIQTHGSVKLVPIAIVSGFILSLLVPLLIIPLTSLI